MKTWLCVLFLLPTFVLRPVVVPVHNGHLVPGHENGSSSFHLASLSHSALRVVERENQDLTAFIPPAAKMRMPSISSRVPGLQIAATLPSPKHLYILRI